MKILLATEGSDFSRAAVEKCCEMFGRSSGTEIRIVSVAEPTYVPAEPFAISAGYIQEADRIALERAKLAVAEAEQHIRGASATLSADLQTKILGGEPERAIPEDAEKWGADLIIVGSHGYGFWNRTFL